MERKEKRGKAKKRKEGKKPDYSMGHELLLCTIVTACKINTIKYRSVEFRRK